MHLVAASPAGRGVGVEISTQLLLCQLPNPQSGPSNNVPLRYLGLEPSTKPAGIAPIPIESRPVPNPTLWRGEGFSAANDTVVNNQRNKIPHRLSRPKRGRGEHSQSVQLRGDDQYVNGNAISLRRPVDAA